jgi:hypothetical protein
MGTPTRRDLFKYAVGATLVSALPVTPRVPKDPTTWPLVVDLSGPMAFEYGRKDALGGYVVDVWLPHLEQIDKHEAGIVTPGQSYPLSTNEDDYTITGPPNSSSSTPNYYLAFKSKVFKAPDPDPKKLNPNRSQNRFIHLTLPMPKSIVALLPVPATITGPNSPSVSGNFATGLRFLYATAGTVKLVTGSTSGVTPLNFDPLVSDETQLNMSIVYSPFNSDDPNYANAHYVFTELALLFLNSRSKVVFDDEKEPHLLTTPLHPCKAPMIALS